MSWPRSLVVIPGELIEDAPGQHQRGARATRCRRVPAGRPAITGDQLEDALGQHQRSA